MKLIELQLYKTEYFDSINRFSLPEDQLLFTALPNQMAEITHEKHPVVILCGMEPVGFFVLHSSDRVKEYTENPDAMPLTAFRLIMFSRGKDMHSGE